MKKMFLLGILLINSTLYADVHTVTNTHNSGAGSLRQAILDANNDTTIPRIIYCAIGSGIQTIQPQTPLPAITGPYTILDGTSQPGWSGGNPQIVIDGSSLSPFSSDGITIMAADHCIIQGFVISNGF